MIRAVLFDMGGVLLSLQDARGLPDGRLDWRGRQALLSRIRSQGGRVRGADLERLLFAPWRRDYERRYELGREADWKPHLTRLRRHAGVRLHDATLLGEWFRPYGEGLAPCAGAAETLARLRHRHLRLAVVSNVPLPGVLYRRILERHGMAAAFDAFHFSYDGGSRKPSPAMVRRALSDLGVRAGSALMVGDRRGSDIAAGRSAGVGTVWLRSDDGGGPQPDHTIDHLSRLVDLLDRLDSAP
jgi:HAD superfamily hydrolase (TIGR01549 family)